MIDLKIKKQHLDRGLPSFGMTAVKTVVACIVALSSPTASLASEYDFDRWKAKDNPILSQDKMAPVSAQPSAQFLNYDQFVLKNLSDLSADRAGFTTSDAKPTGARTGFFGGIDTTTALFYSAGATLGLIGANLQKDPNQKEVYGGTSFLEDPSNFVTDEFQNQYGLGRIKAQYAYARGHTGSGVLVSVMDTPFNTGHTNLDGAYVAGYDPATGTANVDINCQSGSNPCQHGTHVAGIIGARKTNSGSSMHGVAYDVKIKPVAFLNDAITTAQQQVDAFAAASGVDSGTGKQIVAMNNSWGPIAGFHTQTYQGKYFKVPSAASILSSSSVYLGSKQAAEDDTIMVFAAGNDGWNSQTGQIYLYDSNTASTPSAVALARDIVADTNVTLGSANIVDTMTAMPVHAPDTTPYIIDADEKEYMWLVVVATNQNDTITSFSNGCGDAMNFCLAAPGDDINSTNGLNASPYVELPGTSMAAPHVTGAIALLAEMYPNLLDKPENFSQILLETATDLGEEGVDEVYGHGLLNLKDATGPLGTINIADSNGPQSSSSYGGGATIEAPVAFGDALDGGVEIGGLDKYERVFMLQLPVQKSAQLAPGLATKSHQSISAQNRKATSIAGLSFNTTHDQNNELKTSELHFSQETNQGIMTAHMMMGKETQAKPKGMDGAAGYARYFDDIAVSTGTERRLALSMASAPEATSQLAADIRIDRNEDNDITMLSQSSLTKQLGPVLARFTLGGLTEQGRFLGGDMTGALSVHSTHTIFAKSGFTLPINRKVILDGYYELGHSNLDFVHDNLVNAGSVWSDTYGLSLMARPDDQSEIFVTLRRPVAIVDGQMALNTITGYTADGDYHTETLIYKLAPKKRETELLAEYRQQFFPGNMLAFGVHHQQNALNLSGVKNSGGYIRSEWIF